MIRIRKRAEEAYRVVFMTPDEAQNKTETAKLFGGMYLETFFDVRKDGAWLLVGLGSDAVTVHTCRECAAGAAKVMQEKKIEAYNADMGPFYEALGAASARYAAQGLMEGHYEGPFYGEKERVTPRILLVGIPEKEAKETEARLEEGIFLTEEILWARDMVNTPGNLLKPMDFAREIQTQAKKYDIDCEQVVFSQMCAMGMNGLVSVGKSSENPPCLLLLRYKGDKSSDEITGLVGKGVTCDTGGYCLKPAGSMLGIKGDMAGGAAVAAAVFALAKNKARVNVTAAIPMCENRISQGSLVPGDVITSYSGKTIEIRNTDAEGRLILADAMSYLLGQEKVSRVADIATLTGAVAGMLGFTITGVVSDDDAFYGQLEQAARRADERILRIPFYEEHEKMLESAIADIRNLGEEHCGTITAGLFIRSFAQGIPWIHLDIAGTAWVDTPIFACHSKGATGVGVSLLYELCTNGK